MQAYYPDTSKILVNLGTKYFRDKKMNISQYDINLLVNRCNGDREIFYNELKKVELYSLSKKVSSQETAIITNLLKIMIFQNLIICSAKNKRKLNILNENNFSNDDCNKIARHF